MRFFCFEKRFEVSFSPWFEGKGITLDFSIALFEVFCLERLKYLKDFLRIPMSHQSTELRWERDIVFFRGRSPPIIPSCLSQYVCLSHSGIVYFLMVNARTLFLCYLRESLYFPFLFSIFLLIWIIYLDESTISDEEALSVQSMVIDKMKEKGYSLRSL